MKTDQIRKKFLDFFKAREHQIVKSDSLVPEDDPTLLFTGAGMNQFKDYFLGKRKDMKRAVSSQKCLRTPDLENVGRTSSHHTFFEMLGNFSFGDYFKGETIAWAWEFLTRELKLPAEKLWVSVYEKDDEAYQIWLNDIKLPKEKIVKLGDKPNFWPSEAPSKGPNGPCGPCSEIFYDHGPEVGCKTAGCSPDCDCGRFIEVWNLVFTQYDRQNDGSLKPLPNKNIDTGMGLERLAAVMQGVKTNFEIDIFQPIIKALNESRIRAKPPRKGTNHESPGYEEKAIVDHARAITFLIADGVLPSNEKRGYVLRMLIRRANRLGRRCGLGELFLHKLVPAVSEVYQQPYPELKAHVKGIVQAVKDEEERFNQTIEKAENIVTAEIEKLKAANNADGLKELSFKFYDTYGYPIEMTIDLANELGLVVNREDLLSFFETAMNARKETSRAGSTMKGDIFSASFEQEVRALHEKTEFVGYDHLTANAEIKHMFSNDNNTWVVMDQSPFYGESGGQAGDTGVIKSKGFELEVIDVKNIQEAILHKVNIVKGQPKPGVKCKAIVNKVIRQDIAANHTATHLLQSALRQVLGDHVRQAGSLVESDRLRFDFTHQKQLSADEIIKVEEAVNENIIRNNKVVQRSLSIDEARASGAIALFGEKYKDEVRVISIGNISKELCGGTHLKNSKDIGVFKIVAEASVASGVRRIEAVTNKKAYEKMKQDDLIIKELSNLLKVPRDKLEEAVTALTERIKNYEKEIKQARSSHVLGEVDGIISSARSIGQTKVISYRLDGETPEALLKLADALRAKLKSFALFLISANEGKVSLICALSPDIVKAGLKAGDIIKAAAQVVGGGGGGRPDMAQAGGKDVSKIDQAIKKFDELISEGVK